MEIHPAEPLAARSFLTGWIVFFALHRNMSFKRYILTENKMVASGNKELVQGSKGLAQSDLRLVALALIDQAPRHGYEIIKLIEEKTADWYSPAPGIVYPTLTFLEEAGYVTVAAEGAKKLYTITAEGRAYLDANRDLAEVVLDRLTAIGERVNRWRRAARGDREQRRSLPPLVEAAFDHLRETVGKRLEGDAEAEARLVEILARAAGEMQRRN